MIYSFDTNVLIDVANDRTGVLRERLDHLVWLGLDLRGCVLVVHELEFGASISRRPDFQSRAIGSVLSDLTVEPLDLDDIRKATELRLQLRRAGRGIGHFDLLVAGQAARRGWTVITRDQDILTDLEGVVAEPWPSADPLTDD